MPTNQLETPEEIAAKKHDFINNTGLTYQKDWRKRRGLCVLRSDVCPPTPYELAVAEHNATLRKMILGPNRRRCLPEVQALASLAQARFNWPVDKLASKTQVGKPVVTWMLKGGLIPLGHGARVYPALEVFIRLGKVADLGMCDVMEIWKRSLVPRQYDPWRALFPLGPRGWRGRKWPDDGTPGDYKAAWDHFQQGFLGFGAMPSWHLDKLEKLGLDHCLKLGMTEEKARQAMGLGEFSLAEYWGIDGVPEPIESVYMPRENNTEPNGETEPD